jgi:hypothetical protein
LKHELQVTEALCQLPSPALQHAFSNHALFLGRGGRGLALRGERSPQAEALGVGGRGVGLRAIIGTKINSAIHRGVHAIRPPCCTQVYLCPARRGHMTCYASGACNNELHAPISGMGYGTCILSHTQQ